MRFIAPSGSSACHSSLHPDAAVGPRFKDKIHDSREIGKCPTNGKDSAFRKDQTRIQGKPTLAHRLPFCDVVQIRGAGSRAVVGFPQIVDWGP
jgi:hypothetical protein